VAKKTASDIMRDQAADARKAGDTSRADQLNAAASQMDSSDRSQADNHTGVHNTGFIRGTVQNGGGPGSTQSGSGWCRRKKN
jgi:hypothetical protein